MSKPQLDKAQALVLKALYAAYNEGLEGLTLSELTLYVRLKSYLEQIKTGLSPSEAIELIRVCQGEVEEIFIDNCMEAMEVLIKNKLMIISDDSVIFITHPGINWFVGKDK
jgi:hypothetical protein